MDHFAGLDVRDVARALAKTEAFERSRHDRKRVEMPDFCNKIGHKRTHALQHDLWIKRNTRLIADGSLRPYNARHERA